MTEWIDKLEDAEWTPNPNESEKQARMLMEQVNVPDQFMREMFAALALPMVQEFVEAADAQLAYNRDLIEDKMHRKDATTTAQEAAAKYDIDLSSVLDFIDGFDAALQWPDWMIDEALKAWADTISKPYWADINATFAGRAEALLKEGIERGLSIQKIAKEMREASGNPNDRWIITRSKNIARTETGHMAGAGNSAAIDKLSEETGLNFRKEWMSVFGSTSRESHMAMHGQMSDENGMFNLNGVVIPWPSHTDLPPSDRCNCMCSIVSVLDDRQIILII